MRESEKSGDSKKNPKGSRDTEPPFGTTRARSQRGSCVHLWSPTLKTAWNRETMTNATDDPDDERNRATPRDPLFGCRGSGDVSATAPWLFRFADSGGRRRAEGSRLLAPCKSYVKRQGLAGYGPFFEEWSRLSRHPRRTCSRRSALQLAAVRRGGWSRSQVGLARRGFLLRFSARGEHPSVLVERRRTSAGKRDDDGSSRASGEGARSRHHARTTRGTRDAWTAWLVTPRTSTARGSARSAEHLFPWRKPRRPIR